MPRRSSPCDYSFASYEVGAFKGNSTPSKNNVVTNFDFTVFHCVIKSKHLPSLFFHSFIIISFIKVINRTTQIHQPITFDYFEHQPITEKMGGACGDCAKTIKTILVAEKI